MSDAAYRSTNPEQHPAITSLTSMFPIHIDTPAPAGPETPARAAQRPMHNANRPPVRHAPGHEE